MRSAGVLALGLAVAVARLAGQQLVATERAEVVATLWAEARYNFALWDRVRADWRSEEHTSELQSQSNLVCRLLLEKKKHKSSEFLTGGEHEYYGCLASHSVD